MKTDYTEFTFTQLLNKLNFFDLPNKIKELFTRVQPTYKVYTAIITQTSTNTPTAEVIENNIGNIVWTRANTGVYEGTLVGAFTGKTLCFVTQRDGNILAQIKSLKSDNDIIEITLSDIDGVASDLAGTLSLEVRVYN